MKSSIRVQLIGAALTFLFTVATAAPAADPAGPEASGGVVTYGEPLGALLYDQTDGATSVGMASQEFEPAMSSFDCRASDDFEVPPAAPIWSVAAVQALGFYLNEPAVTPPATVTFFADAAGAPGASVCSRSAPATDLGGGQLEVVLDPPCELPAGTYWVSVQADLDFGVDESQWFWGERDVVTGTEGAWENPGDGFATGCTSFQPMTDCGAQNPSLLFALIGEAFPVELQSFVVE